MEGLRDGVEALLLIVHGRKGWHGTAVAATAGTAPGKIVARDAAIVKAIDDALQGFRGDIGRIFGAVGDLWIADDGRVIADMRLDHVADAGLQAGHVLATDPIPAARIGDGLQFFDHEVYIATAPPDRADHPSERHRPGDVLLVLRVDEDLVRCRAAVAVLAVIVDCDVNRMLAWRPFDLIGSPGEHRFSRLWRGQKVSSPDHFLATRGMDEIQKLAFLIAIQSYLFGQLFHEGWLLRLAGLRLWLRRGAA